MMTSYRQVSLTCQIAIYSHSPRSLSTDHKCRRCQQTPHWLTTIRINSDETHVETLNLPAWPA